ncbi:AAA family ATPase [Methylosinus sporium]|uniref:AAA family ATPase n=1 Tax=Methylosinus sporium TaxID=428 RepID=UPI00383AF5D1
MIDHPNVEDITHRFGRVPGRGNGAAPQEPPNFYAPPGAPPTRDRPKFMLEPFETIRFESDGEWLVKRMLPRQGVGAFYGASQSFKSFVVSDLAWHVALGWEWAGRRVTQTPAVYIAAEGAAGLRKRKIGFERSRENLPAAVPFYLIPAAPNLGTEQGDLPALIAAIEVAGVAPGLIVVDTLAQTLGAGDENGGGMITFVANATALANHFRAFVLIVHHVGLGDDKRMRGHSSLIGAIDAQILCERREGDLSTTLTLQKLKDEESRVRLAVRLSRVVIGRDEDGEDVSTLIVDGIEETDDDPKTIAPKSIPASQRLFMEVVAQAIDEAGKRIRPSSEWPIVSAVSEEIVRERYYERIAETPQPDDTPEKLAERQRKGFNRAAKAAIDARRLLASLKNGERVLWLP